MRLRIALDLGTATYLECVQYCFGHTIPRCTCNRSPLDAEGVEQAEQAGYQNSVSMTTYAVDFDVHAKVALIRLGAQAVFTSAIHRILNTQWIKNTGDVREIVHRDHDRFREIIEDSRGIVAGFQYSSPTLGFDYVVGTERTGLLEINHVCGLPQDAGVVELFAREVQRLAARHGC